MTILQGMSLLPQQSAQMEGSPELPHCTAKVASLGLPPAPVCYLEGSGAHPPYGYPSPELIFYLKKKKANPRLISIPLALPGCTQ